MQSLLIVTDHAVVAESIRLALRQTTGFQVVGFVDGRTPITALVAQARPDVVLVDDMLKPGTALERLHDIAQATPDARVILFSDDMEPEWLDEAFEAGADTVISKTVHAVSLGTLLRESARDAIVHRVRHRRPPAECPLTGRELEILRYVAEGYTNSRIAREIWVTEPTVKFHLSNTYRKLGVANRTEASRYAYQHDLVTPREKLAS